MRKILFVIDTLEMGGAEKSILDIAKRFQRYRAVVCHIYPGDALKMAYQRAGIEVFSLNVQGHYNFMTAARALQGVIDKVQPSIIHSTLFRSDMVARWVQSKNDIPLINGLVNNSYHPSRFKKGGLIQRIKLKILQMLDAVTARRVDLFISNSEAIKASNGLALRLSTDKIKVIYRGRDVQHYSLLQESEVATLRGQWGIGDRRALLNVSRLLERKGQLDLLRAFRIVLDASPDLVLLIAGEGPFRDTLEAEIATLGLSDSVFLIGTRTDIPVLLKLANVFVFPSHYEGLPGALIEAMMARTPIVASNIPENLECVSVETARVFRHGNVGDLAQAILDVLQEPGQAAIQAGKAYEAACQKFDIHAIALRYECVYDELLHS